jgi:hypothetical protein
MSGLLLVGGSTMFAALANTATAAARPITHITTDSMWSSNLVATTYTSSATRSSVNRATRNIASAANTANTMPATAAKALDTIQRLSLDQSDTTKVVTFDREVFQYTAGGRRDPFVSLLTSDEIRPLLSDLRLTAIAYDLHGRNSVAVLRDIGTKAQYRVKVGSPIGRMRVVRIDPKVVTFVIEEFGYSRQETLAMGDSTNTRQP